MVGEVERLLLLVGHQDGGDPDPANQGPELAPGPLPEPRVEVGERLVEEEHPGLGGERPGQRHPLLLPSGERAHRPPLEPGELHQLERRPHPPLPVGRRHAEALEPEGDVLPHVEVGEERIVLEHHPEPPARRRRAGDVLAVHHDTPLVGDLEPGEQAERRGLAASARAQQREEVTPRHAEREPVHRGDARESLREAFEDEERALAHRFPVFRTR